LSFACGVPLSYEARLLKAALDAELKHARSPSDGAHLKRWVEAARDPAIERLGREMKRAGVGDDLGVTYSTLIAMALYARRLAEEVKSGVDLFFENAKEESEQLLRLAQKADDLATFYQGPGLSGLMLLIAPQTGVGALFKRHGMMPLQELARLHQREAQLLRQYVEGHPPTPRTRISRQSRERKAVAFMHLMVRYIRELCGKPHREAVAAMTNIAFPEASATTDSVRATHRPTTPAGRSRKTGTRQRSKRVE
jgi:hypothetical protein